MLITKRVVRDKLLAYLNAQLSLSELVDWAENAMMEDELSQTDAETLRDIIAHIGLADVREFGLSWDDCASFMNRLGYRTEVNILLLSA